MDPSPSQHQASPRLTGSPSGASVRGLSGSVERLAAANSPVDPGVPQDRQVLALLIGLLDRHPGAAASPGEQGKAVAASIDPWRELLAPVVSSGMVDAVAVLRSGQLLACEGLSPMERLDLAAHDDPMADPLVLAGSAWTAAWGRLDAVTSLALLQRDQEPRPLPPLLLPALERLLQQQEGYRILLQQERRVREQLQDQVMRDPLTGMPNRIRALQHLEEILQQPGAGSNGEAMVLFLDLDNFKQINDAYGHRIGDCFLITVSKILRQTIRHTDLAARLAGDEFIIICQHCSPDQALALADRLIEEISKPMTIGSIVVSHSASIGIARVEPQDQARTVIENADLAMMRAKQQGRGTASRFELQLRADAKQRGDLDNAMRMAIRQGEIRCRYQPIVQLAQGRICGFEALARWHHPARGMIDPGQFIPAAEESGLIDQIDLHVIREACMALAAWRRELPDLDVYISANLSARSLRHPRIVTEVQDVLRSAALAGHHLVLEITETVLVDSITAAAEILESLRDLGIRLAIDDFGTGYSSLRYLRELPVASLKIDKSFVDGLGEDGHDDVIVTAVTRMAASLGLDVIAEGVERQEQSTQLQALGCRLGQGYWFGRPVDAGEAHALLLQQAQRIGLAQP